MSPKKKGKKKAEGGRTKPAKKATRGSNKLGASLDTLFVELVDGPPGATCFVLNKGDAGFLKSLDNLSAAAASNLTRTGSSIAAHVDHLRFGFALLNRWAGGDPNPWANADWTESWRKTRVNDEEWKQLRGTLRDEAQLWRAVLAKADDSLSDLEMNGAISSVVHLAYHFGAIRQIDPAARGPKATD